MHIHYFQHVPFEGLGCIADWIARKGHQVSATHWYKQETPPALDAVDWLIVLGGPMGVYDQDRYPWLEVEKNYIRDAVAQGKRVLGICLGAQLVAAALGAKVYPNKEKEIGWFPVHFEKAHPLVDFMPVTEMVFHWHGDTFDLPENAVRFASTPACRNQAFIYGERTVGLQFHFEATATSVDDMIHHGKEELIEATYIQRAEEIRAGNGHIAINNQLMFTLLDRMEK
ncbi:type 1 glutamine amidotransferase [Chitinophaga horti]|uniref:Type 1 glutamine amidotransferase n=1 Tax=Chitinophaga horti TaxID=2920382 RepID=A0ABY6IW62_9BACT|nr:type 1 glutamine amidotransferase [Chitinophaga horti]UYQ91617.1 type 1 glutamine amidotransferase [Chitinophaga horti]